MEAPRRLHEAGANPSQFFSNHGGSTKASRTLHERIHFVGALSPPQLLSGTFVEPFRSVYGAFTHSTSPRCNRSSLSGVFIVNPRPPRSNHVAFQFIGLKMGLGLNLCMKFSIKPPRPHHSPATIASGSHGAITVASRSPRGALASSSNNDKSPGLQ